MAFDFPSSPTVGQKYPEPAVTGLPQYQWDGQKWVTLAGGGGGGGGGTPSDALPLMDSVAAPGVATPYSRGDHVHPSDTTKAAKTYVDAQDAALSTAIGTKADKTYVDTQDAALSTAIGTKANTSDLNNKVSKLAAGDTMSGDLTISKSNPALHVVSGALEEAQLVGWKGATRRWKIVLGNGTPETGSATGTDFYIGSRNDDGTPRNTVLSFDRAGGFGVVAVDPIYPFGIATKQYADARGLAAMASEGMQINGDFSVNQLGAVFTSANGYFCDGWSVSAVGPVVASAQAATVAGYGPYRSLGIVSVATPDAAMTGTSYVTIDQRIEGWRAARLLWGQFTTLPITLSFWCQHTRAGTYSGTIRNAGANRSYAFTYTQNASDVAEYKTISIPAPPVDSAVWEATTSIGLILTFAMACGPTYTAPSANTWLTGNYVAAPGQINGVQATSDHFRFSGVTVLPGTHAITAAQSPLLMRPYDQELAICRRYYEQVGMTVVSASDLTNTSWYRVSKRVDPTITPLQAVGGATFGGMASTPREGMRQIASASGAADVTFAIDARF